MANSDLRHYAFDEIRAALGQHDAAWINRFEVFDSIGSSNDYLMHSEETVQGRLCLAEYQSQGKGRHGKRWQSEAGSSLMFSLGWKPKVHFKAETSLVVGVALADALQQLGVADVGLKWPNDVLVEGQKLAGILLESRLHKGQYEAVLGVGLNLVSVKKPWQDLSMRCVSLDQLGMPIDRQEILITILIALAHRLDQLETTGFESIRADWQQYHVYQGKQVSFQHAGEPRQGKIIGLDPHGALMLESNHETVIVNSGEVSSIRGAA